MIKQAEVLELVKTDPIKSPLGGRSDYAIEHWLTPTAECLIHEYHETTIRL